MTPAVLFYCSPRASPSPLLPLRLRPRLRLAQALKEPRGPPQGVHTTHCHPPIQLTATLPYKSLLSLAAQAKVREDERLEYAVLSGDRRQLSGECGLTMNHCRVFHTKHCRVCFILSGDVLSLRYPGCWAPPFRPAAAAPPFSHLPAFATMHDLLPLLLHARGPTTLSTGVVYCNARAVRRWWRCGA